MKPLKKSLNERPPSATANHDDNDFVSLLPEHAEELTLAELGHILAVEFSPRGSKDFTVWNEDIARQVFFNDFAYFCRDTLKDATIGM